MTDIHTQIRDNVERLEKRINFLEGKKTPYWLGYQENPNLKIETSVTLKEAELKTTIAENIKWADAMIEELKKVLTELPNEMRFASLIGELGEQNKKWQETKQWLEERR